MKKASYFVIAALFAVSVGFVGCSDDDDDNPFNEPSIKVKVTVDGSVKDVNNNGELVYDQGEELKFDINFKMGADKLTRIKVTSTISGKNYTMIDSTLNEGWLSSGDKEFTYTYRTNAGNTEEKVTVSTTDKKNRTAYFYLTIKPKALKPDEDGFVTSEITLIGAQNNATYGSFYSVSLGKVLTVSGANSQQSAVDFAYFYGASNHAAIAAPDDTEAGTISYGKVKMSGWSTKNSTRFVKVKGNKDKPKEWYDDAITQVTTGNATSKVNELAVGNIVAYKTSTGKTGAFVVTALTAQNTGSISIVLIDKNVK